MFLHALLDDSGAHSVGELSWVQDGIHESSSWPEHLLSGSSAYHSFHRCVCMTAARRRGRKSACLRFIAVTNKCVHQHALFSADQIRTHGNGNGTAASTKSLPSKLNQFEEVRLLGSYRASRLLS